MATVTDSTSASSTVSTLVSGAASSISALDQKVSAVVADVEAQKSKIVAALQAHIQAHQADIAKHTAEVNAAATIIAQANPTATTQADTAAAYILTSSSKVQGVINFLGKNWRYVVGAAALGIIAVGKFVFHI